MIVFHTSYTVVKFPDTRYSREALDFGKGFYVTTAYDEEWLDFVSANRKRLPVALYDAVEGGVANVPDDSRWSS